MNDNNANRSVCLRLRFLRRKKGLLLATVCLMCVCSASLHAGLVIQPSSLEEGDKYRLVFVTSGITSATSSNIDSYNAYVTAAANSVDALSNLDTDWSAIASTVGVNARSNTGTDPSPAGDTGVPIYLLNDTQIAANYDDLWDGALDAPIFFTELGTTPGTFVWTGSTTAGFSSTGLELGSPFPNQGQSVVSNSSWINVGPATAAFPRHLYAMSGTLTAVPEPGAFQQMLVIALVATCGVVGVRLAGRYRKSKPA